MSIGNNIKKYRIAKNFSQQKLAELIGKSKSSVEKYESDKTNVPMYVLDKIAEVLEVNTISLLVDNFDMSNKDLNYYSEKIEEMDSYNSFKDLVHNEYKNNPKYIKYIKYLEAMQSKLNYDIDIDSKLFDLLFYDERKSESLQFVGELIDTATSILDDEFRYLFLDIICEKDSYLKNFESDLFDLIIGLIDSYSKTYVRKLKSKENQNNEKKE